MPTESFTELLDRDRAKVEARELIEAATPLLRELVNNATWVCIRCMRAADNDRRGDENEDVASFVLYQQLIEQIDAVEVLMSESCVNGTVPILRSAFEVSLSLDYILTSDAHYVQRSLAWFCCCVHQRIRKHEGLDRTTMHGANRIGAMGDFGAALPAYDSSEGVKGLQSVLARPQFAELEADYAARQKKNPKHPPEWFSLLGGPRNRRLLARFLKRETDYLVLYGDWSDLAHAEDAATYLAGPGSQAKQATFKPLRFAAALPQRAFMAASFILSATRLMLGHFRPNEPGLRKWYLRDIKSRYQQLAALRVNVVEE